MTGTDIEVEDPALAAARYLLTALEEEPPDILVFGESTLTFVGPEETDRVSVADRLTESLRPKSSFVVAAPGFNVEVHHQLVRLAATRPPRPLVVTSLYTRGTLPAFLRHPVWGHRRQIDLLTGETGHVVDALRRPYDAPGAEEWAAYEAMPYPTFIDAGRTIADFMAQLRPAPVYGSDEHWRWLFEFHYGGSPNPAAVRAFTAFGRTLRERGFPVIAFQNPVNVVEATERLGPEFIAWHRYNTDIVHEAFVAGYGPGAVVLETADGWMPDDFIEPAVEHLAAPARIRLAAIIADAVRESTEV
jgi:hypothetical protein